MGSGFDNLVYWHFFTITVSSHIELLLNVVCLTNFYEESRTDPSLLECTKELPFTSAREPNREHRLRGFHYCSS
jgi:hypothetical protein